MYRLAILAAILFYFSHAWATDLKSCSEQQQSSLKNSVTAANGVVAVDKATYEALSGLPANTYKNGRDLSSAGKTNNAAIDKALSDMKKEKKSCDDACDAEKADKESDKAMMRSIKKVCDQEIGRLESQVGAGKVGNTTADKGGDATADKAANENKQTASGSPMMMPPMSMPQSPQQSPSPTPTPTPDTQTSATPQTTPAPAAQPASTPEKGTVGYTQSALASACGNSSNPSEIEGCQQYVPASAATPVSPFPASSSTNGSGIGGASSGGGSSGGGISASQVASALAGRDGKISETEKDGKNGGLKAASLNLGTEGGGGGGGSSSGSGGLGDLDFGFKPSSVRGPSSASHGSAGGTSSMASSVSPQVAAERFSVVKIVTDVYVNKCKKGPLNCGTSK